MNYFDKYISSSSDFIKNKYGEDILLIDKVFNIEMELLEMIIWTTDNNIQATNRATTITFSGFYKSIFSLYGAYRLNLEGQYGSSRILMRHAFEYLLIAKYCSVSGNQTLIQKWEAGEDIYLSSEVLNKLISPLPKHFRDLWKLLCQFAHATVYSQQVEFDASKNHKDISMNFSLIRALLEMNYHLFNRHFINNSMLFYYNHYGREHEKAIFKLLKQEVKGLFSTAKKNMSRETKQVIKDYKSSWQVNK